MCHMCPNSSYLKSIYQDIGIGFAVVPLIGLVETIAIGKAFGKKLLYFILFEHNIFSIKNYLLI